MASWREFERAAPELAVAGRALVEEHMIAYLATVRPDGSPRVHPVSPIWADDDVFVAIAPRSPKWRDLEREPRCVIHALPGPSDAEFLLRCRGSAAPDALDAVRAAAGHTIHDDDQIVRFDIERADHGWWEHVGQPNTYPLRRRWTPGEGVVALGVGRTG